MLTRNPAAGTLGDPPLARHPCGASPTPFEYRHPVTCPLQSRRRSPSSAAPLVRVLLVLSGLWALLPLSGCETLGYYQQAVDGHLQVMRRRQGLGSLIADPGTDPVLRQRLQLAQDAREFASRSLALPDNGSYRSFADIGREAVVWVVVAAPRFSVRPRTWCYPVIGCAAYRGYYELPAAREYARRLAGQGFDVALEPVPAYSTLGWFDDPLLNTVIGWPAPRLAGLMFHELAHQQLYVAGDSAFNEAFASLVEQVGVERWLASRGDAAGGAAWAAYQQRKRAFVALLLETRQRLERLYRQPLDAEEMARRKQAVIRQLEQAYRARTRQGGGVGGYDAWFRRPVNNARLALIATYERWIPVFSLLLQRAGGDLTRFYRASRRLAELPAPERKRRMESLLAEAGEPAQGGTGGRAAVITPAAASRASLRSASRSPPPVRAGPPDRPPAAGGSVPGEHRSPPR